MKPYIETGEQLKEYFWSFARLSETRFIKYKNEGVLVTSKVRKEFLTSVDQGKIVVSGVVWKIDFHNLGGGVYRAFLKELNK